MNNESVRTGNPVIDEFFRELDARLDEADHRLPNQQKAMLKKVRPQFLQAALQDPDYFVNQMMEAATDLLVFGKGS